MIDNKDKIENEEIGFFIAPNAIFETNLDVYEISIYLYLCRCGNNSTAFPSYNTISKKVSCSRSKAISVVQTLKDKKLLEKIYRKKEVEIIDKKTNEKNKKSLNDSNIYMVKRNITATYTATYNNNSSVPDKPPLVHEVHYPSPSDTPPLVHEVHYPSPSDTPYKELLKNNYLEKELYKNNYKDVKHNKSKNKNTFLDDSVEIILANLLYKKMQNNLHSKKPNFQSWAKDINKLIRIDNRKKEEIQEVIVFSQQDEFWRQNIRSAAKLRAKYETLYLKMISSQKKHSDQNNQSQSTSATDVLLKMYKEAEEEENLE